MRLSAPGGGIVNPAESIESTRGEVDNVDGDDLRILAQQVLDYCREACEIANSALSSHKGLSASSLAATNSFNDAANDKLAAISAESKRGLESVLERPTVARLEVTDDDGATQTIFITPGGAPAPSIAGARVASYRSPMGRLAAASVGSEVDLGHKAYTLQAKTRLLPRLEHGEWNAYESRVEALGRPPRTIISLRGLVALPQADALDLLEQALRGDPMVFEGFRRAVVERMSLREQPVLDAFQDDIYRLPLDTQLVVLGPPGSGKTTTLIKRLGMKLDDDGLSDAEKRLVDQSRSGRAEHRTSWLMFSPNELLRQYVKEAFAREQVPASDRQMVVWERYRDRTARNVLGILQSGASRGARVRPTLENLAADTIVRQVAWFEDFLEWQEDRFWSELNEVAAALLELPGSDDRGLTKPLTDLIARASASRSATALADVRRFQKEARNEASTILAKIDQRLREAFAEQFRADPDLVNSLSAFVGGLGDDAEDSDDIDYGEDDEDEGTVLPRGNREAAFDAYIKAMRAQARALAGGRRLSKTSRNGRIIEWIGDRTPPRDALSELGVQARRARALRRLANPLGSYVRGIPLRYRRFRRDRAAAGVWYIDTAYKPTDLNPLELDLVLLAVLRRSRVLLANAQVAADLEANSLLGRVAGLFKTQVLVDEATDFSPIQLACMAALADPIADAFVACGDFNQRITEWGVRTSDDLKWVHPDLTIHPIKVSYRHSRQLNSLAHRIAQLTDEDHQEAALPEHVDNEGVDPILGVGLSGENLHQWLADRILEIEKMTGQLPSLAILVNAESEVKPLAAALDERLADHNIKCMACVDGQFTGDDADVRVFDVQHIKGLEFEGAFFIAVDRLAEHRPKLFDKFLYVGVTRAAMYLGMTTESDRVPAAITAIEDAFVETWSSVTS
ncbi:hypothetical protein D3C71_384310 [compost metagenome]